MTREFSFVLAHVVRLQTLTPSVRRLVVGGAGAGGWRPVTAPDTAVLLVFPGPTGVVALPGSAADEDPNELTRWYTVRRYDERLDELTVDLVAHPLGLSTRWWQSALPGDPIGISSAATWWNRPADATWQLLVGDLTALPAISRALEDFSADVPTQAVLEVPTAADEQRLEHPPGIEVRWVHTARGPSQLERIARSLKLPPGPGYVYAAGEARAARAVRRVLRHERVLPGSRYYVSGYWRERSDEWMRRFRAVEAQLGLAELYARFEAADADKEALTDELDRRLEAAGL